MAKQTLNGSLALTKLPQSAIIEKQGKSGIIRGVFLPIDGNSLTEKDGAVYMDIRVVLSGEKDKYDNDGFVAKSLPTEVYKAKKDDQAWRDANQPILGNVRDFTGGSNNSTPVQEFDDTDELPF